MKRIIVILCVLGFAAAAQAQRNAEVDMYLPPNPTEAVPLPAGTDDIICSFNIPTGSALFGVSEIKGTSDPVELLVSSQVAPYTIYRIDENCTILSTWSTASTASSMLGITYDVNTTNTYWMVYNQNPRQIVEYQIGTGTPTGRVFMDGTPSIIGPLCSNENTAAPYDFYYENIASDIIQEFDPIAMTFGCTFANPDNTGSGAFGNGIDDSVDTSCGSTLTVSSGTIGEGLVVRAGQFDCTGTPCPDTWDFVNSLLPAGATFLQSFAEFTNSSGEINMAVCEGNQNTLYIIRNLMGINDCQGIDGEDLFTINLTVGGPDFTIPIGVNGPMTMRSKLPAAGGRGKYAVNWNAGWPDDNTIVTLPANLGPICFQIVDNIPATQMANFNNIGRTNRLGASNYFGVPVPRPRNAPSIVLQNGQGDPTNMPVGSCWTVQGIMLNPGASADKPASVSNAMQVVIQ